MHRNKHHRFVSLLGLAILALFAVVGCRSSEQTADLPPARGDGAPAPVELPDIGAGGTESTAEVVNATVGETTGTTYPIQSAQVAAEASGVIRSVSVDEGDHVRRGQLLFRLQTKDMQLQVQQAKAALASAKVSANAARIEYDRMKRLHDQDAIDDATWDKARAGYEAAKAAVAQAQVGVDMATKQLRDASVRSPIDGVVTQVAHDVGDSVSTMPPTVVVVVEDHSTLELRFSIPEELIPSVKVGDPIDANFRAVDITREARVTRVSPRVDPRTRTVQVVANIDNHDGALKSGMLAVIELGDKATDSTTPRADQGDGEVEPRGSAAPKKAAAGGPQKTAERKATP